MARGARFAAGAEMSAWRCSRRPGARRQRSGPARGALLMRAVIVWRISFRPGARRPRTIDERGPVTQPLPEGVYESLRTRRLDAVLAQLVGLTPHCEPVDPADVPHVLGRHVADVVTRALNEERDPSRRLALVNDLLERVAAHEEQLPDAAAQLVVLSRETATGCPPPAAADHATVVGGAADQRARANPRSAPSCAPRWRQRTASTCSAPSSAGPASACSSSR